MTNDSVKLLHVLLGKAVAETVLVGALALVFFFQTFPPHFRGWGEVDQRTIAGWATNMAEPGSRVSVQLFVDGIFVAQRYADQFRPDVHAAGWATDDWHGYRFEIASLPAGPHQARIYAVHASSAGKRQTLQLLGDAIDFAVDPTGQIHELKSNR